MNIEKTVRIWSMAGWLHHRTVRTCGVPAEAGERPSIGWSRDSSDHAI